MRRFLFVVAMLAAAQPAVAAEHRTTAPSAAQAAQALGDPLVQDAAARTLTQLAAIVLDTRVGPLAALTDPRDHVRPNDTLRDVKRRDDPQYEQHLYADTRRAVGTAGAAAGAIAEEAAEVRRTATRLHDALAPLLGSLAPADEVPRAGE